MSSIRPKFFLATRFLFLIVVAVQWLAAPGRAQEPLRVVKSYGASSIGVGERTSLTIEIVNQGPNELTGVSFLDSLPTALIVANPSNFSGLTGCMGGNVTAEPGGQSISLAAASLTSGSTCRLSVDVTALTAGVHKTHLTVTSDQVTSTTSISSLTVGPGLATIDVAFSPGRATFGSPIRLTATVAGKMVRTVPTGTVTFMDGSETVGVADLSQDGVATLSTGALLVGERLITAVYGGDKNFTPTRSLPVPLIIGKNTPSVTVSTSPDQAVFGDLISISAKVSGYGRAPTGQVMLQHSSGVLGTALLSQDGIATIATSKLIAGKHEILALYEGDEAFEPSRSTPLSYTIHKAPSSTTIHLSSNQVTVGDILTVKATVVSKSGVTPTGRISFSDGTQTIVRPLPPSQGLATYTATMMEAGKYRMTATYSGDENFAGSEAFASIFIVQSPSYDWTPGLLLLAGILLIALIVPLTRLIFRQIGRALRALRRLPARAAQRFKVLQRFSRTRTITATESAVGVGVGALNRALAGATEIEREIAQDFNRDSVDLRKKGFVCTWIDPVPPQFASYNREQAELDAPKVKHLLSAEIPLQADPLNLFDDIAGAFEVYLLKDSDKATFYVLWEFKRAITGNVLALSVYFSAIVFAVLIVNVFFSTAVDFSDRIGLAGHLPLNFVFLGGKIEVAREAFNSAAFAIVSCLFGAGLMWFFRRTVYSPFQRYNGQHLKTYLVGKFASINGSFRQIHNSSTQTIILVGRNLEQMKKDTVLWQSTLWWMAFRAFFIESYLRNILFQIRRNSSYYLLLVPLAFLAGLLGVIYLSNKIGFYVFDLSAELARLNFLFYPAFGLLLWLFFVYLKTSLSFVWESVEAHEWLKFNQLKVQDTMTDIMHSYVTELDKWVSKYSGPEHG